MIVAGLFIVIFGVAQVFIVLLCYIYMQQRLRHPSAHPRYPRIS